MEYTLPDAVDNLATDPLYGGILQQSDGQLPGGTIMISTTDGAGVSFPAPRPAPLPPVITTAEPPANQGNQKVLIGGLAVVLIILAAVGLRSHGE